MEKFIEKATVLIEALPYIQQFRGDTIVVWAEVSWSTRMATAALCRTSRSWNA
jgi:hypothetical protein